MSNGPPKRNEQHGQKRKNPFGQNASGKSDKRIKSTDAKSKDHSSGNKSTTGAKDFDHTQRKTFTHNGKPNQQRNKMQSARQIATSTTTSSFSAGNLNLSSFVASRSFEVNSLSSALVRAKSALTQRAFQQVPRDMRRRAGAWNVKRVPERMRRRAKREAREDGSLMTAGQRRRKVRKDGRADTVRRLRLLGRAKVTIDSKKKKKDQGEVVEQEGEQVAAKSKDRKDRKGQTRDARLKMNTLRDPPRPKKRFAKRQKGKHWLPTHMYHTKRTHMSSPLAPVWGFAMPLTPTEKCYRPTHRATTERGCITWDTSYVATIGIEGVEDSLIGLLKGLGSEKATGQTRDGVWHGWTFVRDQKPEKAIAPITVIWMSQEYNTEKVNEENKLIEKPRTQKRRLFIRVHPSAFFQLWEQVIRLCKVQKPQCTAEDLRYEIGSIEVQGPGAMEVLQSILTPVDNPKSDVKTWQSLVGLNNPALLPSKTCLAFDMIDPRLRYPPRTLKDTADHNQLLENIVHLNNTFTSNPKFSQSIFDSLSRRTATAAMPSQKSINHRKSVSEPGTYPLAMPKNPKIPVIVFTSSPTYSATSSSPSGHSSSTSLIVLLPWSAIQPTWYSIMHYPLSTGNQPRLGCLAQQRQICFEQGMPWFPGDYPGTQAGNEWIEKEIAERQKRWKGKPKGRRVEFDGLDLGNEEKEGEVGGDGCGFGWDHLFYVHDTHDALVNPNGPQSEHTTNNDEKNQEDLVEVLDPTNDLPNDVLDSNTNQGDDGDEMQMSNHAPAKVLSKSEAWHMPSSLASSILFPPWKNLTPSTSSPFSNLASALFTVRITFLGRGTPSVCARIYNLPLQDSTLISKWKALLPQDFLSENHMCKTKDSRREKKYVRPPNRLLPLSTNPSTEKTVKKDDSSSKYSPSNVAHDLLHDDSVGLEGEDKLYPPVPRSDELIGFVTTGGFNLKIGKGSAIASLSMNKVRKVVHALQTQVKNRSESKQMTSAEMKDVVKRIRKEARICIVRNSGEIVGRLAIWDIV